MKNNNKLSNVEENLKKDYFEIFLEKKDTFNKEKASFKKYEKPIINSINQMAGGTKVKVVGQMSEIVPDFIKEATKEEIKVSPANWRKWYNEKYPENFSKSLEKIKKMNENFKKSINEINDAEIEKWLINFLFTENIKGLLIQYEIMDFITKKYPNKKVRAATAQEEKKNIDIVIDDISYQVKPFTMKQGTSFQQKWNNERAIWYKEGKKDKKEIYKFYLPKSLEEDF